LDVGRLDLTARSELLGKAVIINRPGETTDEDRLRLFRLVGRRSGAIGKLDLLGLGFIIVNCLTFRC
jgi:hypothetical protein